MEASALAAVAALAVGAFAGCGDVALSERLSGYREELGQALEPAMPLSEVLELSDALEAEEIASLRLPQRRDRRLEVQDLRMGPFDFLATIGCSLSEVVAERNGALGKVLEPTRRLQHELRVIDAMTACLPTLSPERAGRLAESLAIKRSDLGRHLWNAVWLDADLERFLSFGPAALIGGEDSRDGSGQMMRAARALRQGDVAGLELAFSQLRDDPAIGKTLVQMGRVTAEFERISALVAQHPVTRCGKKERRLAQVFRSNFVPLQMGLGELNRKERAFSEAFEALFQASTSWSQSQTALKPEVPALMRAFRVAIVGDETRVALGERFRSAMRGHAAAWAPLLEACDVIPKVEPDTSMSAAE